MFGIIWVASPCMLCVWIVLVSISCLYKCSVDITTLVKLDLFDFIDFFWLLIASDANESDHPLQVNMIDSYWIVLWYTMCYPNTNNLWLCSVVLLGIWMSCIMIAVKDMNDIAYALNIVYNYVDYCTIMPSISYILDLCF